MVNTRCSASDRMRVPARPAQHVHRRVPTCAGGSNIAALEGGERLHVYSDNQNFKIGKIDDTVVIKLARLYLARLKQAALTASAWSNSIPTSSSQTWSTPAWKAILTPPPREH